MKTILTTLALIVATTLSFGQIKEGKVEYDLRFSSSQAEVAAQLAMMQGSKLVQTFAKEGSRVEMNMGMFQSTTTITNVKDKKTLTLMGGMMGYKATLKDYDENAVAQENPEAPKLEKTEETKTILGYKCKKYFVDMGPEEGMIEIWTTEEIAPETKLENQFTPDGLVGFPIEITVINPQITINIVATKVTTDLKKENKKDLFSTKVPEGYELVKEEDLFNDMMEE